MAKNGTVTETPTQELTTWQPKTVSGDFESLLREAKSITEFALWSKIECSDLVGQPFLIVDVHMVQSDLYDGNEYAQVFLVTRDNQQRYFSTSALPIVQAVRAIMEQGIGREVISVAKGLSHKTVPAKAGGLPDGSDRPAFDSYSFAA